MCKDMLWDIDLLLKNYPAFKLWGLRHLIRERRIPMIKIGRRIYFDPNDIKQWIDSNKIKALDCQNGIGRNKSSLKKSL